LDRPLVVLIHGWCCHPGFWRHQFSAFAAQGYLIAALDLRQVKPQGDAIDAFAEYFATTAAAQDRAGIVLVGHSMGGAVAVEAGIRLGPRCRLVLGVDTFTDAAFYTARPGDEIAQRTAAFATDFAGTIEAMADRIIAPGNKPGLSQWVAQEMAAAEPNAALWALRGLLAWDITSRLPALQCEIETINSAWLDRSCNQVAGLDGVRVHPIEGVGHFPMLEAPETFNALALAVLNRA
jgi:pimeloyl-ACP methyl ester carboxylesterase